MTGFMNPDGSALVGGLLPSGVGKAFSLDMLGNLSISDWIRTLVLNGQGYAASTGKITNAAGGTFAASVFNPLANTKNIFIYEAWVMGNGAAPVVQRNNQTVDPAFATALNAYNLKGNGPASSLSTSLTYTSTTTATAGNQLDVVQLPSQNALELCTNGFGHFFPAGVAGGLTLYIVMSAAGNWGLSFKWVEF